MPTNTPAQQPQHTLLTRIQNPTTNNILLFGCQSPTFTPAQFHLLRRTIHSHPENHWVLDAFASLPSYIRYAESYLPFLRERLPHAEEQLCELRRWVLSTDVPVKEEWFPLPYVLHAPLFMVGHLVQFGEYVRLRREDKDGEGVGDEGEKVGVEIVGFCIGFLSAAVAAAAGGLDGLKVWGAVGIRLAMLLGAMGDAMEWERRFTSVTVTGSEMEVKGVLEEFPEAYITVRYDSNRSTIMTPRSSLSTLLESLRLSGLTASHIDFNGRYHWSGHSDTLDALYALCDAHTTLQLPDASHLRHQTWTNITGEPIHSGPLHRLVLQSVLSQPCMWYQTFSSIYSSHLQYTNAIVIEFGHERCIPQSFLRNLRDRIIHFDDLQLDVFPRIVSSLQPPRIYDDDIAMIGMAVRVAGADDLDEFWQLLCAGKSQHRELPPERYKDYETPWRPDATTRPWMGNFIADIDAFDHKFFRKVPREVMAQDPQQRLLLQVAYQALEQAGYFSHNSKTTSTKDIGCYVSCCTVDYEHNVNCHPASAYAATGLLRSFIAGKLSHYFGWRGPALCIDTACSGSTVALHHACRAILNGDCKAALVGGVNCITSPLGFDNLNGASFLSPTGPCKPFDAKADGYCRGEGVAAIFIKRMRDALKDGDHILGTISGTAVEQNDNCTPVVVPHAGSLAGLFRKVMRRARIHPGHVSVVEAHGTGTQAGDPAEYASVSEVMGGVQGRGKLSLGSVKGLVGHTEGVSGMVALVKVLLMIHEGRIPPQPSFETLDSNIKADEKIVIPTESKRWEAEYRVALINNYGACGSNASVVVTQGPMERGQDGAVHGRGFSLPFRLCGLDENRIRDYARRLRQFLKEKALSSRHASSLANMSFSSCRQSNPTLDCQLVFSCSSIDDLEVQLASVADGRDTHFMRLKKQVSPIVLCFGGQVSTFVGLDRTVYETIRVFRDHLDNCDRLLRRSDYPSLYPGIFERIPVTNHVKLQTQLFSLQYACARSWMDCGVPVSAVVGHSFGELTAMCVSGVLSLEDALTLIVRRARLIRDNWGTDPGGMIAVEGERVQIDGLLTESAKTTPTNVDPAAIACFNGPRSFTLAGPIVAINVVQQTLATHHTFSRLRWKRLDVTNAFHSTLVEPLMSDLHNITQDLTLSEPNIHLEPATEHPVSSLPPKSIVSDHLRQSVYFSHAVQRLVAKYPSCIWLEAGSGSTITLMVSRALEASSVNHRFQSVNITGQNGIRDLTDATMALWKEGVPTIYWAHHFTQTPDYGIVLLPPYQFEKSRHWMDNKPLPIVSHQKTPTPSDEELEFLGYQDKDQLISRFRVNTAHPKYREALSGHVGAQTAPLAPASHMLDNVVEALRTLPEGKGKIPQVRNVTSDAPLGLDSRDVYILLHAKNEKKTTWDVKYISEDSQKGPRSQLEHCVAQIKMFDPDDAELSAEFARYGRLINHRHCQGLLNDPNVDDVLQGRNIYRYFSEVVEYSEKYRGVTKLVGKGNESAGCVVKKYSAKTWADTFLCDSFSQVGGFWVNCMTDRLPSDIYIASGMEQWMRTPLYADPETPRPETWDVLAIHERSDGFYTSDIFVFDPKSGRLVEMFIGMKYSRVPKAMFCKVLSKLNSGETQAKSTIPEITSALAVVGKDQAPSADRKQNHKNADLPARIKSVVAEFCAVDPREICDDNNIADAGVDSLMAMELARELEEAFNCSLSATDLMEAETFRELVCAVQKAMGSDMNKQEESLDSSTTSNNGGQDTDSVDAPSESNTSASADTPELHLPEDLVLKAFGETKALTDHFLSENHCSGRVHSFNPLQMQLCVTLTLEAFETLGSYIRTAQPGERLDRIWHDPQHQELVDYLYRRLEEARLVDMEGTVAIRTKVSWTYKASAIILEEINRTYPEFAGASKLAFYTGSKLASVLRGDQDGLQLIFGTKEGQELVSWMYGDESHNVTGYKQMLDFIQRLASKLDRKSGEPLRILEMGGGTGGGTKWLLPGLAELGIAVEYTFSDISPAFLAQARRRFKDYSFVKYRVHDIKKAPADDLVGTQHIIIASNAVHATSNLQVSTRHMRDALRPDGVVMMLEMTQPQFAIDIVFGLFRGWWVFNDGRTHAITSELRWETDLHAVGYGHVDWTDGYSPEVSVQRVIFATCTGKQSARLPLGPKPESIDLLAGVDSAARRRTADGYIWRAIEGFTAPIPAGKSNPGSIGVLVTGSTGSLGGHLVAHLARMKEVGRVFCINRRGAEQPMERQRQALTERGIILTADELNKVEAFALEDGETVLGLSSEQYETLKRNVTHIIHNAWPMNGAMSISAFESQFRMMRSLVDLASKISSVHSADDRIGFQFISSIGTVGHRPLLAGEATVLEEHGTIDWALTNGYAEAKFVCEQILHRTLCHHPDRFNAMVVRPGQIAGSSTSGYWNAAEHFPALLKSAQTLKILPSLDGVLSWTPVDVVAATLTDLLFTENPHPVYHIDNAARQSWSEMIMFLAPELNIPPDNIIPFPEWIQRTKSFPGNRQDNPAGVMADWLSDNFERMSCGGLLLDTSRARERSPSLRALGPVGGEVVRRFIQKWRQTGFLHP